MSRMRGFFRSPFGSALVGGAVVALFGWVAISAGWIEAEDGDSTTTTISAAAAPLPAPISDEDGGGGNTINRIYRRDGRGVAFIEAGQSQGEASPLGAPPGGGTSTGSGFVIDTEGHLITNSHVVEGATDIEVKLGSSETTHSAEVVGTDPATDVALLKVGAPADQLHPLALGDSSRVRVGDPVVAIGNPFGLDRTVTSGIVSALQRQIEAPNGFSISHVIQTDAAINPGNSGGPLIDIAGNVIGINAQIQSGTGGNVGIGFAIPINTAREVVRQLKENGEVEHAFLGVTGASITADIARAVNLPVDKGVLVQEVAAGGPAEEAGIEGGTTSATIEGAQFRLGGDIITEIDGKPIASMNDVIDVVNGAKPGDELKVTILRGGDTREVTITLGERPASARPR
jgi:S1-C subfamily serine protease